MHCAVALLWLERPLIFLEEALGASSGICFWDSEVLRGHRGAGNPVMGFLAGYHCTAIMLDRLQVEVVPD